MGNLEFVAWDFEIWTLGIWVLVFGFGIWCLVYEVWSSEFAILNLGEKEFVLGGLGLVLGVW